MKALYLHALYQVATSEAFEWLFDAGFIITLHQTTAPMNPSYQEQDTRTGSTVSAWSQTAHTAVHEEAMSKATAIKNSVLLILE